MFGITDLTTFIIGTTLIVLLPGPNSLYVMSIASRFGIKTGYMGALGVYTGDLILIICTALGAASLLHAFPVLFIALKVIGAIYLSYLGIKLIIAAYQTFFPEKSSQRVQIKKTTPDTVESVHPFRTALTISILNPKAILFYLSFFCAVCRSCLSLSCPDVHATGSDPAIDQYDLSVNPDFFWCKTGVLFQSKL